MTVHRRKEGEPWLEGRRNRPGTRFEGETGEQRPGRRLRDTIIPETTNAMPRQIGSERRFADAADTRQEHDVAAPAPSRRMEKGEKPGCRMFPAQKEFVAPPDEFGQRSRIRCNLALKGQAVTTMQPSPARPMRKRDWTKARPRPDRAAA